MGLDMYLRAQVNAPKDSPLFKVIEENLTDEHRKELVQIEPDYPDFRPYAYVSGWTFGDREPEDLYVAVSEELGFAPTEDSPSMQIKIVPNGYMVEPTIYYWRKANEVHRWFVENCQGGIDECQPSQVHVEQLMDLLDRCERIVADHNRAEVLLPTQAGFFFGGTEYDEWYFRNIEDTAKGLKEVIAASAPKSVGYIYQSSW